MVRRMCERTRGSVTHRILGPTVSYGVPAAFPAMPLLAFLCRLLALVLLVAGLALSAVVGSADGYGPFAVGIVIVVTLSFSVTMGVLARICADLARVSRYIRSREAKEKKAAEAEDPVLAYFS